MVAKRVIPTAAVAIVVAGGAIVSASRQGPPPPSPQASKAVVMKGKAPVSTELLKITLPRPAEVDLPNGVHLMVLEDHRTPQIVFQIEVPGAGGYFDPADMPGLASITATMMREGTTTKSTTQIAEQLERNAASVGAGAGLSSIDASVSGSSLTDNFDDTFALAADVLLNPTFPDEELQRYKQRIRTQLIAQRTQAGFLASEMFNRVLFGTHPASRVSLTAPVLDKVTRDMLVDFHKAHWVPDHAVIAMSGDITMAAARKAVEAKLAGWKKGTSAAPSADQPPQPGEARIHFVARPNSVQTNFLVGAQSLVRTSPDYDVLSVMNEVLGGGPTGRLFTILREEKGYTYGAYSGFSAFKVRGNWSANTQVRNDVTEAAFKDLMAQIARMRDEPVPDKELEAKKRGMIASFALSLESPQALLNNYMIRHLYGLPADYWDKYPQRISAITQAQVQEAAKKYLDPPRLQIIAVGDPKLGEMFKKYGTVVTYDTEGKIVSGS